MQRVVGPPSSSLPPGRLAIPQKLCDDHIMLDINHSNLILESSQNFPRRVGGERGPGVAQGAIEPAVASAFAFRHAENTVLYVFGLFG